MQLQGKHMLKICFVLCIIGIYGLFTTKFSTQLLEPFLYQVSKLTRLTIPTGVSHNISNLPLIASGIRIKVKWIPFNEATDSSNGDMEAAYHKFVKRRHMVCQTSIRVGNVDDGGWDFCLAGPYEPVDGNCLVYSFGINLDWTFDEEISDLFGCQIRAFDPTMGVNYTKKMKRGKYINFYPIGLSHVDGDIQLLSFTSKLYTVRTLKTLLIESDDEQKVIDYLKLDIESSEWKALLRAFQDNILPKYVKQIGIELHSPKENFEDKTFKTFITILNQLEAIGFRKWHVKANPHCMYESRNGQRETFCYEVYYINLNFFDL